MNVRWIAASFLLFGSAGCMFGTNRPLVLPTAAELGDTVVMSIDSSYTDVLDGLEYHDLSVDNVEIEIWEKGPSAVLLDTLSGSEIRAVFDGHASASSTSGNLEPGLMLTAVMFDLPATLPVVPPFPQDVEIKLRKAGEDPLLGLAQYVIGDLTILGTNGSPIAFNPIADPVAKLQPSPALRLRGRVDAAGTAGFDPNWEIGSIEFDLFYPEWLVAPRAVVANEAFGQLATLGPVDFDAGTGPGGIGLDRVRVVLLAPDGFEQKALYVLSDRGGEGPFLDIVFENLSATPFNAGQFYIQDLHIHDPSGVALKTAATPTEDGSPFFFLIPRANGS